MNNHNIKKLICSIIAIFIASFSGLININAYDAPLYCDLLLTRYQQENTKWCWAACAQMVANYQSYQGPSQTQIVTYVKGSPLNQNANIADLETALEFARYCATNTNYTATTIDAPSYDDTRLLINNNTPMVAWMSFGHDVVLCGFDDFSGDLALIADPAVNCGETWYSYSELMNGCRIQSGTGYCQAVTYLQ